MTATETRSHLAGTLAAVALVACTSEPTPPAPPTRPEPAAIRFTDVTDRAGVSFRHRNAASGERHLPETMGAGVAVFDADGDGDGDLLLVNGLAVDELGAPPPGSSGPVFYRNRGDGTFDDVTRDVGLGAPLLGMGVAVGDLDNDGDLDLLLTGVGGERCYRNRGDGTFDDVTRDAGLESPAGTTPFGSSAAFVDVDRDGWLDLFVGRYVEWSPAEDIECRPDGVHRSYCTPEAYPGAIDRLYRNRGDGTFEDITRAAGLDVVAAKTLGVAVLDLGDDLWPDLAVASDTSRNLLFRNRGDGSFVEVGVESGIALGQSGAPRGAMGIDAGDLDGDLRPDLVIGNFAQEMAAVYRLGDGGVFVDEAARLGVGLPTLMRLAFGVLARDLDADGWLDLVFVNGHIEPDIARFQPLQTYAQPPSVFRNLEGRAFVELATPAQAARQGDALAQPIVGRGLAAGDLDGDGDLDLVVTENGGRTRLLRNDSPRRPFLRLRLEGRSSNRTGYGAAVEVDAGGRTMRRWLTSGSSYLSASEPLLTFGLGDASAVEAVRVRWPSGIVQQLGALELGSTHLVIEPILPLRPEP